jgi:phosphotriesterase-related protein
MLEQEGVSPQAWVWTHSAQCSEEGRLLAARKGAWISIDDVHKEEIERIINVIMPLKSAGFLNQVLISHDAGWFDVDTPGGGDFNGFTDIFKHLVPELKKNGINQEEIDQLLIENPKQAFTIRVRENGS